MLSYWGCWTMSSGHECRFWQCWLRHSPRAAVFNTRHWRHSSSMNQVVSVRPITDCGCKWHRVYHTGVNERRTAGIRSRLDVVHVIHDWNTGNSAIIQSWIICLCRRHAVLHLWACQPHRANDTSSAQVHCCHSTMDVLKQTGLNPDNRLQSPYEEHSSCCYCYRRLWHSTVQ